jgi:hypothetical protein
MDSLLSDTKRYKIHIGDDACPEVRTLSVVGFIHQREIFLHL